MIRLLRKVAARVNKLAGVNVQQTYLYRISNPGAPPATAVNDESLKWELLSPDHVGKLCDIGPFERIDGLSRLDRGDLCYTVSVYSRLAHYSWVQRAGSHPITEAGVTLPVENGDFWIYNCRTVDWARGMRIYPATLKHIISDHFAQGYVTGWIYTTRQNISSQRGISRAGFRQVATLSALRVGTHYFRPRRVDQGQ